MNENFNKLHKFIHSVKTKVLAKLYLLSLTKQLRNAQTLFLLKSCYEKPTTTMKFTLFFLLRSIN